MHELQGPSMAESPASGVTGAASSTTPVTCTHALSIQLDEKNFLLQNQQVEGVIIAHKLHRYVVNPTIPQKYALEFDREIDLRTEEYHRWLVQDQMLFT